MVRRRTLAVASGVTAALLAGSWSAAYALSAHPAPAARATAASAVQPAGQVARTPVTDPTPTRTPTTTPAPRVRQALARNCSISAAARDPRLASFQGRVVDDASGEVLFDRRGAVASRTASVLKLLTTAAALEVLGPDHRFTTTVVKGSKPGQIVLVGGGDVTLSRTPVGTTTAYAGAPHLATLVAQVKKAWAADPANRGQRITQIVLDSSYFGGPSWQPTWHDQDRIDGYMPRITALMVDGDRDVPSAPVSYRGLDPVGRAGAAFAAYFGPGVTTVRGTAPAHAARLGLVRSQPVSTLVQQTLIVSDNTIAEALARETAIVSGAGDRFTDEQQGTVTGLQGYGIDTSALRIVDGSGLSDDNAVPPTYLTRLLHLVRLRVGSLGAIYDGLPVSGRTGSLSYSDRFQGAAARADGAVHAKTGWIDTGYTLAGVIHAKDGTPLVFAFYALGHVTESTKAALDELTADAWACGSHLSNR
ncbi:D-alanyl-D-alanine carboxypeptidase [Amnibacterium sp. CER49]|uniref:D-alanyl-D-alanine carboxypeptidase/D-alanyl-D-alanine-endopeptidase n=1 Tax=Amnibacterium sp. CER49 TaxID=3039161 RepID=UPI00244C6BDC|nr:D-alanyl-D-alanine carboxypeptidase [Amnibacterium sp. CER49]MDH2443196.1 D-alanyl-D-alanine carboxypeptidase [Amnibacterium sp. CER49]